MKLGSLKEVVELFLLRPAECELDGVLWKFLQEGVEVEADLLELLIGCGRIGVGKHIMPNQFRLHDIEDETAEEAVFSVRDKVQDLLRCAGQDGGKLWLYDFNKFMVFFSEVGNGFVVEGLSEAVGVVAEVGIEGVGEGVAFGFKEKADTVVLGKRLIDDRGCAVCRDEQSEERRLFGRHFEGVLAVDGIGHLCGFILFHLFTVFVAQGLVDGCGEVAAKGEATFASRGAGGDEQKQV